MPPRHLLRILQNHLKMKPVFGWVISYKYAKDLVPSHNMVINYAGHKD